MAQAPQWRAIGRSVRGASHVRSGKPNQDAFACLPRSGTGPPLIVTVSDGHGSAKSFRSDVGSRLAADKTAWLIQDLLDGQPDPTNLSAVKRTAEERLPQEVVRWWRAGVKHHISKSPFTPEELDTLEQEKGVAARLQVEHHPTLAYGATILSVLVTEKFILYLQLGDGDILVVQENGEVVRPIPGDERLFANETMSLCMEDAWREVRMRFQALYETPPPLILLTSDGYGNSFVNDDAFFKVGSDLLEILQSEGLGPVERNLEDWLREASETGSGDDVTLGLLCRTDILGSKPHPAPLAIRQETNSEIDRAIEKEEETAGDDEQPAEATPSAEEKSLTTLKKQQGKSKEPHEPAKYWHDGSQEVEDHATAWLGEQDEERDGNGDAEEED